MSIKAMNPDDVLEALWNNPGNRIEVGVVEALAKFHCDNNDAVLATVCILGACLLRRLNDLTVTTNVAEI